MAKAPWEYGSTGSFAGDLLRMGVCFEPISATLVGTAAASATATAAATAATAGLIGTGGAMTVLALSKTVIQGD